MGEFLGGTSLRLSYMCSRAHTDRGKGEDGVASGVHVLMQLEIQSELCRIYLLHSPWSNIFKSNFDSGLSFWIDNEITKGEQSFTRGTTPRCAKLMLGVAGERSVKNCDDNGEPMKQMRRLLEL